MEKVKVLGRGQYGTVYLYRDTKTEKYFVVKGITRFQNMTKDKDNNMMEHILCSLLKHKNIVKCMTSKLINNGTGLQMTFEYANKGNLFDYITKEKMRLSEDETKVVIKDILEALKYCHNELKVCHADLKPENILIFEEKENLIYKIADWGVSKSSDKETDQLHGTLAYIAPEIVDGKNYYCDKTDMWAVGCIMYFCLTGEDLFDNGDQTQMEVFNNIRKKNITSEVKKLKCSEAAKNLLLQFFGGEERDPKKRITAEKALQNAWFN